MRALIVDDSRAMRRILRDMLAEFGFDISEASNGAEALAVLQQQLLPDFVLVDWNMPVMTGLEFVQAVRADERYGDLRLMMVTTETEMSQVSVALAAGVNEYVMKPFDKEVIAEKLQLLGVA